MSDLKNSTTYELTLRHARLMNDIEKLPSGSTVTPKKIKEKADLEETLQNKLYSLLIGDVLPIIPTAIKRIPSADKIMITFHFEVFSSLNTKVDRFKIDAPTKTEAWKKARKKAKTYPGSVNLKIS